MAQELVVVLLLLTVLYYVLGMGDSDMKEGWYPFWRKRLPWFRRRRRRNWWWGPLYWRYNYYPYYSYY